MDDLREQILFSWLSRDDERESAAWSIPLISNHHTSVMGSETQFENWMSKSFISGVSRLGFLSTSNSRTTIAVRWRMPGNLRLLRDTQSLAQAHLWGHQRHQTLLHLPLNYYFPLLGLAPLCKIVPQINSSYLEMFVMFLFLFFLFESQSWLSLCTSQRAPQCAAIPVPFQRQFPD